MVADSTGQPNHTGGEASTGVVVGQSATLRQLAGDLVGELTAQQLTVAAAESLTGGQLSAAITAVAGASACFRGGIVSYSTDLKASLLDVDPRLLAARGPVDPQVAWQMARSVARICGAVIGMSTTGVAGPDPQAGVPVGTVFISVHDSRDGSDHGRQLALAGTRGQIQVQTVAQILSLTRWVAARHGGAPQR